MNDKNQLFITRAELKSLYNDFYTTATSFPYYFAEELGIEKTAEEVSSPTQTEFTPIDTYAGNDQAFVSELTSLFDPTATSYSKEAAKDAENIVAMECSYPGMVPTVKTMEGNGTEIVVSASYTTPKGVATISVPVEISGKKASGMPSYFKGKDGRSHYLSRKSVANYIKSSFDKASSYDAEVGAPIYDVEIKQDPNAVNAFSLELETPMGVAQFEHGNLVEAGRRIITAKMRQMGKRSAQVKVLDSSKEGITYGVGCNGIAFKVPVKIESGKLMDPAIILCKGSIEQFDAAGVASLQKNQLTDSGVAAAVSPLFDVKPSDLVETVREAANEGNYVKAEDALNVLSESGDEKAYSTALAEYSAVLSGISMSEKKAHELKHLDKMEDAYREQPTMVDTRFDNEEDRRRSQKRDRPYNPPQNAPQMLTRRREDIDPDELTAEQLDPDAFEFQPESPIAEGEWDAEYGVDDPAYKQYLKDQAEKEWYAARKPRYAATKNHLLRLASELENPNHETLIAAEEDEELLNRVAMSFAKAAQALRDAAGTMAVFEPAINLTEEKIDEIAAVAQAFDESGDDLLRKQASILDEVLMLFASPKAANLIKKSKEEMIDALKNKDMWMESKAVKDAVEKIKESPVYKEYRPLEAPLSTRICPEHQTPMTRIAEGEYQCSLDGHKFNWAEGYEDMHKNVVPGTVVQNQNVYDEGRFSYSSTEDSRLDRMGLKNI
ncbi:unnamed protein product [Sphagnum jensenii]